VQTYVRAYLDQVRVFVSGEQDHRWALGLDNATGAVRAALRDAQQSTRIALLDRLTVVQDAERGFRAGEDVRRLDDEERAVVERAYAAYLDTVPDSKRLGSISCALKDVVGTCGSGIGSAGLPAYRLLVEGRRWRTTSCSR
jgi:uncharacterized protein (DUF2252 family)